MKTIFNVIGSLGLAYVLAGPAYAQEKERPQVSYHQTQKVYRLKVPDICVQVLDFDIAHNTNSVPPPYAATYEPLGMGVYSPVIKCNTKEGHLAVCIVAVEALEERSAGKEGWIPWRYGGGDASYRRVMRCYTLDDKKQPESMQNTSSANTQCTTTTRGILQRASL